MSGVDPADTRDCDGYPGLAEGFSVPSDETIPEPCCGDPGDCGECGA